jgi:hypothetical protein
VAVALGGCASAGDHPAAQVVLPEIGGAVVAPANGPTLRALEDELGIRRASAGSADRSGTVPPAPGSESGAEFGLEASPGSAAAAAAAARVGRVREVAAQLDRARIAAIVRDQAAAVQALESEVSAVLSEPRAARIAFAGEAAREAVRLLSLGNSGTALDRALLSTEAVHLLDPAALAGAWIRSADEVLRREGGAATYSREDRLRAQRLLTGARAALGAGDALMAMQRAHYACGLLGAETR